jgi:MOSC domain-containing protein YiiM
VPATLLSVNVGRPQTRPGGRRWVRSAIWKHPVEGRVAVRGASVDGDEQADLRVHGGPDKAVYAYASEDTAWWAAQLARDDLGPGAFGENLTLEGVDVSGAEVGERWEIGSAVLEVVQPRLPCFKLGVRFEDRSMLKRFAEASRPGAYLRIVREGELGAGDEVRIAHRPGHGVTMALMSDAILLDHSLLGEVRKTPGLIDQWHRWIDERLAA